MPIMAKQCSKNIIIFPIYSRLVLTGMNLIGQSDDTNPNFPELISRKVDGTLNFGTPAQESVLAARDSAPTPLYFIVRGLLQCLLPNILASHSRFSGCRARLTCSRAESLCHKPPQGVNHPPHAKILPRKGQSTPCTPKYYPASGKLLPARRNIALQAVIFTPQGVYLSPHSPN